MNKFAVLHVPQSEDACPLDNETLLLRVRTAKGDARSVNAYMGHKYIWSAFKIVRMEKNFSDADFDYFTLRYKTHDTRILYYFEIEFADGKTMFLGEDGLHENNMVYENHDCFQYPFINEGNYLPMIEWTRSAVAYQIFPDSFYSAHPKRSFEFDPPLADKMYGGDLDGITEKMDYIAGLGVNLLYLTPVFESCSVHRYNIDDYFKIDEKLGGERAMKDMVNRAHEKGIRVVLDGVFNHSGHLFKQFKDVCEKGRKSPYYDWYCIDGDRADFNKGNYKRFSFANAMPRLNGANEQVQQFVGDVCAHWIKTSNIDGWRLDVSDEIDGELLRSLRRRIKKEKADALIIGEDWHDSRAFLRGDMFDGVMNYGFNRAACNYGAYGMTTTAQLTNALTDMFLRVGENAAHMMFNLIGSHDTPRFCTRANGNKQRLRQTLAMMFFFPGIPMVYYGDEIGMTGGKDPDCRHGFIWNEAKWDTQTLSTVKQLAALKNGGYLSGDVKFYTDGDRAVIERSGNGKTTKLKIFGEQFEIE